MAGAAFLECESSFDSRRCVAARSDRIAKQIGKPFNYRLIPSETVSYIRATTKRALMQRTPMCFIALLDMPQSPNYRQRRSFHRSLIAIPWQQRLLPAVKQGRDEDNQLIANLIKRARRSRLCHFEMILDLPNTIHRAHGFLRKPVSGRSYRPYLEG